ncbi:MAG: hypothetical protein J0I21_10580 [Alphaproteobacteria bacterium]|nr:hypothetical protein [Alphaproteobacteria bacterium]
MPDTGDDVQPTARARAAAQGVRLAAWAVAFAIALAIGAAVERMSVEHGGHLLAYIGAGVLGLLVGATELVSRYRDAPLFVVRSLAGMVYMAVNAAVALSMFWFFRTGQIAVDFTHALAPTLTQVLVAGVGGMALLRTSLFTLRVKEADIAIGPAAILQVILAAADRACDRDRAGPRAIVVKDKMRGVAFERAKLALPAHCLALMQNISAEERSQLDSAIAALSAAQMDDEVKSYNLGLLLMNYVGETVLGEAVRALGPLIAGPAADTPPILAQAASLPFADLPALIEICLALDPVERDWDPAKMREAWLSLDPALVQESDKVLVVLARLRKGFGADTLAKAITYRGLGAAKIAPVTTPLTAADFTPKPG